MNESIKNPQKSEIWWVDFNPAKGQEIKKPRPALIVNENAIGYLGQRIVVPITEWNSRYVKRPWMIKIAKFRKNGLTKDSAADGSQIRSVSLERFGRKSGVVTLKQLEDVLASIIICIGFECPACSTTKDEKGDY